LLLRRRLHLLLGLNLFARREHARQNRSNYQKP